MCAHSTPTACTSTTGDTSSSAIDGSGLECGLVVDGREQLARLTERPLRCTSAVRDDEEDQFLSRTGVDCRAARDAK